MPLIWLSIAFLAGNILASFTTFSWLIWAGLSGGMMCFLVLEQCVFKKRTIWKKIRSVLPLPAGVVLLFFAMGGLRYISAQPQIDPSSLAYFNDRGLFTLTGVVAAPPDRREDAVYLDLQMYEIENPAENNPENIARTIHGTARVRLPATATWEFGDELRFNASPLTPSEQGNFSYKDFLSRERIYSVIYYPQHIEKVGDGKISPVRLTLENWRQKARDVILKQIPMPESALLAGILLGLDNDLPENLKTAYQRTGTAHIIAISGFNMALLAGLFTGLFTRISNRYWAAGMTLLAVTGYTVFVGGSPSVVRAAIMSITALGGHLIGRRQSGFNALCLTAGLMCLVNPLLIGDVSFQLSFAATLGLVLFADPLKNWLEHILAKRVPEERMSRVSTPVSEYFLFTIAAQLTTLPVIAIHFGRISISSLAANPLILPVQPPILILGGISTIFGMLIPRIGKVLSQLVWVLMRYTNWIVELFSRFHNSGVMIHAQMAIWILAAVLVFIGLFLFRNFFKKLFGGYFLWLIFLLILACAAIWSILYHQPDGNLHLDLFRAGDESVVVVRDPEGKVIVFNPGKNIDELSAQISRNLSPWDFGVDEIWFSSRTGINSLELFQEIIPIDAIRLTANVYQAGADQRPVRIPEDLMLIKLVSGEPVTYSSGLSISQTGAETDTVALLLEYKEMRILLPNGIDYDLIRQQFPEALENITFLILNDEDISYIPPRVWQALNPQIIFWNSPSLSPIPEWQGTDVYQNISIITDGDSYSVNTH